MKSRHLLLFIFLSLILLPLFASASSWVLFASSKHNRSNWYYDQDSIVYLRAKSIVGVEIPIKDKNYPELWIKSAGDRGEVPYRVEINCKERTARLQDESGKTVYSDPSIGYSYDRQTVPDSVLDTLRIVVCR